VGGGDANTRYRRPSFIQSTVAAQPNPQLMKACSQNADQDGKAGTQPDIKAADQMRYQTDIKLDIHLDIKSDLHLDIQSDIR
jgi:hypothetical protein